MIPLNDPASLRFKRAQALFVPDWQEGVELVAFVEAVSENAARWIFGWDYAHVLAYRELAQHIGAEGKEAARVYASNFGVDVGLDVLKAMQRGGWTRGKLPKVVRDTLRTMHAEGLSYARIGRMVGMKANAVQWACRPVRAKAKPQLHRVAFA